MRLEPHSEVTGQAWALREARTADRITYEFVSIASHELRAPIAVVHGIAATLDARVDDLPDEQVHALLGQLVVQTDRLRALADQLLDLSRIESGRAAGPPERFDPRERARGARAEDRRRSRRRRAPAGRARPDARRRPGRVRPGRGEPDPERPPLRRPAGRGPRRERVRPPGRRGPRPRASRRSSCRACSSASAAATRAAASAAPGAGLGLSIASAYANALGGELAYEPAQPRGARFTLSLPAARS